MIKDLSYGSCAGVLAVALGVALPAGAAEAEPVKIGITLPSQNQTVWYDQGLDMKRKLEAKGYEVELYYGGDGTKLDVPTQVRQVGTMVEAGCKVLVLTPLDGTAFKEALADAKKKGVTVISYDRLTMGTKDIDYYVCFNSTMTGRMQGRFIVEKLGLNMGASGKTMELFQGDPTTSSTKYFYEGALQELKPYLDSGQLTVPSGKIKLEDVTTQGWSRDIAFKRMDELIEQQGYNPETKPLHAVLSASDNMARGTADALVRHGFTKEKFPVITGQDCSRAVLDYLKQGLVQMSVLRNLNESVDRIVTMIDEVVQGKQVEINDTSTYNNGVMDMKTYMCTPELVTIENRRAVLVDRLHLYTAEDVM